MVNTRKVCAPTGHNIIQGGCRGSCKVSSLVEIPCPQTNNTDRPKMYQRSVRVITPGGVPGVVKCHPYPARPMQLTHYSGRKSIVPMVIYLPTTLCASIEFDDSIANLNIAFLFIPNTRFGLRVMVNINEIHC